MATSQWNEKLSNELSKLKSTKNPTQAQIKRIYALEDIKVASGKTVSNPYPGRESPNPVNSTPVSSDPNNNGNPTQFGQDPQNKGQTQTGVLLDKNGDINKVAQAGPVDVWPPTQATAAQAATAIQDTSLSNQGRDMQMGLANQLQAQANGTAPSLAGLQLQAALDANQKSNLSLARSNNYVNPAVAMRAALQQNAVSGQAAAMQAAQARIAEVNAGQLALAQVLAQQRGADIGIEQGNQAAINAGNLTNAGFQQQAALTNAGALNNQVQFAAQLNAQNNQFNAGQVNQQTAQQAGLNTSESNTKTQANASQNNAKTAAGAQVKSAGIYADASKYAADNSLQAATQNTLLENDQSSPGAQTY